MHEQSSAEVMQESTTKDFC